MAGLDRPKDGVASARLSPAIHVFSFAYAKHVDARHKAGMTPSSFVISAEQNYAWLATVLPSAAWAAARRAIGTR